MESNSNLTVELHAIDTAIEREEDKIKRGEALERLMNNEDFKSVILNGYIDAESKRLFELLTQVPVPRQEILQGFGERLDSIRYMKEYIGTPTYPGTIRREAENAPEVILENEQYRKEITEYYQNANSVEAE